MTESKGAKIFAAVITAIVFILLVVAIILLVANVMANEASIDDIKHELVSWIMFKICKVQKILIDHLSIYSKACIISYLFEKIRVFRKYPQ